MSDADMKDHAAAARYRAKMARVMALDAEMQAHLAVLRAKAHAEEADLYARYRAKQARVLHPRKAAKEGA